MNVFMKSIELGLELITDFNRPRHFFSMTQNPYELKYMRWRGMLTATSRAIRGHGHPADDPTLANPSDRAAVLVSEG